MENLLTSRINTVQESAYKINASLARIKLLSESLAKDIEIPKLKTKEKSFLIFDTDHQVTGIEMNDITSKLQNNFNNILKTHHDVIKELTEVYQLLNYLDKEYISAIHLTFKDIDTIITKLKEQQNEINDNYAFINQAVENFKMFQRKLEANTHLYEIDALWELTTLCIDNYASIQEEIEKINCFLENASSTIINIQSDIQALQATTSTIPQIQSDIQALQDKNSLLNNKMSQLINENDLIKNNVQILSLKNDKLDNDVKSLTQENSYLQKQLQTTQKWLYASMALSFGAIVLSFFR